MPESLRVLQVCNARTATYGAVASLLSLAAAQKRAGLGVGFAAYRGRPFGDSVRQMGFEVHDVASRIKIDPVALLQLRRIIRSGGWQIVHTHLSTSSVQGGIAARLARVPSVASVHGVSSKGSFIYANHMIAVSGHVKKHLLEQSVPDTRVTVVYNGIPSHPVDAGQRAARRAELGFAETDVVAGTVSRLTPSKGVSDALQAVAMLAPDFPDLRYLIVGDGPDRESLGQLATSLGIGDRVQFPGYMNPVEPWLAAMDLFLFPSHKEAMGIALLEAMQQGLPVVAARVGGIPEVVSPESGLLVGAGSPEQLAQEGRRLLQNCGLRRSMGEAGRERVAELFTDEAMERATRAVYHQLLGRA